MRRGDDDNTCARHDEPPRSDQKTERRYEYRRRLIAVEKSWRDAQVAILFWQGVAQGRVRHERFWALLAVGGEAVWGSSSGVFAITRGPESKMSAALSGCDWSEERNASSAFIEAWPSCAPKSSAARARVEHTGWRRATRPSCSAYRSEAWQPGPTRPDSGR